MANVGKVTLEIKPTVTLESAVACVMMLNMFLDDNEGYRLALANDGDGDIRAWTPLPMFYG